jgi:hypothetical protein
MTVRLPAASTHDAVPYVVLAACANAHHEVAAAGGRALEAPALLDAVRVVLDALGHLAAPEADRAVALERGRSGTIGAGEDERAARDLRRLERQRGSATIGKRRTRDRARHVCTSRRYLDRGAGDRCLERRTARREHAVLGSKRERCSTHDGAEVDGRRDARALIRCAERRRRRGRDRGPEPLGATAIGDARARCGEREAKHHRHPRALERPRHRSCSPFRSPSMRRHRKRLHRATTLQKSNRAPTPGFTRRSVLPKNVWLSYPARPWLPRTTPFV